MGLRRGWHMALAGFQTFLSIHYIPLILGNMDYLHVYIVTNPKKKMLHVGMTPNLEQSLAEHYENRRQAQTFVGRYYCYHLVYYEKLSNEMKAIQRKEELQAWSRALKEALISRFNPTWKSLNAQVMEWPPQPKVTSYP
jgi:putative endonuclease